MAPSDASLEGMDTAARHREVAYNIERFDAPLTFKNTHKKKKTSEGASGLACEGCGARSSAFSTRRLFKEHREDCED